MSLKNVPGLLAWAIWHSHNNVIFHEGLPSVETSVIFFWNLFSHYNAPTPSVRNPNRGIKQIHNYHSAFGFFDGVATASGCGAGFTIHCGEDLSHRCSLNIGKGTNTKAELLGLWGILKAMFCFGIDSFRVFGDSSGIVNWDNGTHEQIPY